MISAPIVIPEADLPDWMRRSRRRFDPGLLIVLLFSLGAAWSFLLNPALPRTGDSESYVFRAVDTAAALREGQLYPRWSPHALNGYGAPIPAFYPPAAPYLAGFIAVMFTDDTLVALRLLCAGALLLAGTAVYALVLRRVNAPAGVVAAALYVYSPFIGLTLPHLEGDLAGLLAAALLPALLWAVNRWLALRQPVDFALVAAGTAALLLTQPVYLPVAALLAGGLAALQVLETRQPAPVLPLLAALLAGVALAAFYWLPALVEMPFVRWLPAPVPAPAERLTLAGLVQPMRQIDPAALLTPPLFSLGVVLPGLALLSAATRLALRPAGARLEALFLGLGGALGAVALLLLPEQTWLVGPISLCLAIGSTGVLRAAGWLPLSLRRVLPAALLLTTLLAALPVWFSSPPAEDFTRAVNAGDIYNDDAQVRFEQQGYGIAVLPPGAAIPTTLSPDAPISRALLTGYASDNINRFSANPVLQNNAAVLFAGTHRHRFQISSPQSQTVTMLLAWYPGWQAYLDGVALPTLAAPGGLVNVALPAAAAGELTVRLDSTPARAAAWGISLLALVIISLVLLRRPRHPAAPPAYQPPPLLAAAEARILGLLLLLLGTLAWLSYQQVLPLRAAPQFALQGATLLKNRSDAGLEAYAYRLPGDTFRPGDPVTVTVYWQATAPLTENYRTRLSLRDVTSGTVWAATTPQLPGNFPPRRWSRNRYVPDTTTLPLPADLPPGRYVLAVEAFVCATTTTCPLSTRPGFFAGNGNPVGPALPLRVITVQAAP